MDQIFLRQEGVAVAAGDGDDEAEVAGDEVLTGAAESRLGPAEGGCVGPAGFARQLAFGELALVAARKANQGAEHRGLVAVMVEDLDDRVSSLDKLVQPLFGLASPEGFGGAPIAVDLCLG